MKTTSYPLFTEVYPGAPGRLLIVNLPLPPLPPCAIGRRRIRVIGARSSSRWPRLK